MDTLYESLAELLTMFELAPTTNSLSRRMLIIIIIALLAWLADLFCRKLIIPAINTLVKKTNTTWDDHLLNERVLNNFCHIVPSLVIYMFLPFAFGDKPMWLSFLTKLSEIYIIATSLKLIFSFINSIYLLSEEKEKNSERNRPLKGIFQMLQVVTICVGLILVFSVLLDKSPIDLFVGLGAAATILMLVFKDTIVGLVSGVQLSANDMLRPGDWITLPKHGADGVVFEVNLTTVKIRNWDNTTVTIPPYILVSDSFQNWRGMQDSGGRRIKRSINIDMTNVRFCTAEEYTTYQTKGLIEQNETEITNLTVFRRYLMQYLRQHPKVNKEMTIMVRQLQPTSCGIPLELYFFSANKQWVAYETLQADVFDYVMAILPSFDLRVFQIPSGQDFLQKNTDLLPKS